MGGRVLRVPAYPCHDKRCWSLPQLLPRATKHARAAQAQVCEREVDETHRNRAVMCDSEADRVQGGGWDAVDVGAA